MEASIKLGRIRGIVIGIHYTWLIVFALLTYSLADGLFPDWYPGWTTTQYWVVGALASLLLFVSVVAHELGHSLVANAKGIPVRSITLFIFGGVASLEQETEKPSQEFLIAIAGPAVSLAVAAVSFGLWLLTRDVNEQLGAIFEYLMLANATLVVFNLIPGFPLDGGRVFRSIVWRITHSIQKATRIASSLGVLIGYLFILLGVVELFNGATITGIWLGAIGWFVQSAARQAYQQLSMRQAFSGVQISNLMDPNPVVVHPDVTLDELVERYFLGHNVRGVPVVEHRTLVGVITMTDLRDTPRGQWSSMTVRDRMTPRSELITAAPWTALDAVLAAMSERDIHQVPVLENGALVGLLTRGAVIRFLQLWQELQPPKRATR